MQQKFTFDRETTVKIMRGFLHSAVVTVIMLLLDSLFQITQTVKISDPLIAATFSYVSQNLYNIGKEYVSGV